MGLPVHWPEEALKASMEEGWKLHGSSMEALALGGVSQAGMKPIICPGAPKQSAVSLHGALG